MATTSLCGPICLAIGMASRPGPQPASNTAMPGSSSKRSTMTGCPIGFREGIVQLHQPPQPYRTGDRAAAGTNAPDDGDETDEAGQAKKNVCDRCHGLACLAYVRARQRP